MNPRLAKCSKRLDTTAMMSLAGLHNSQDWLGYDLARRVFSCNWPRARPGEYFECTRKTTKYIASKQAADKARTERMQHPISYQLLNMA